jgi:putative hydrolase of the HAD superfamily
MMYRQALKKLNVAPEEALFIDDSLRNCEGAEQLGIRSLRMLRDWRMYTYRKLFKKEVPVVRDFYGVMKRLNQR